MRIYNHNVPSYPLNMYIRTPIYMSHFHVRLIWDRVPSNSESNPGSSGEAWTNTSVADSETPVGDLSITSGDVLQDMPQDTR